MNGVATDYLLDDDKIVSQIYNNQQIWFDYDAAGTRHAMEYNGNNYYYYYNLQGDVIGLYDSSLNSVVQYSYDSWGKLLSVTGSLAETVGKANPFRYRGYYYDSETELYYLNSRYYDPETGRFINADSILDNRGLNTLNVFAYCSNDPVNNQDPNGHFFFGALVGGIVGGATGAIIALAKGKSATAGFLTGATTGAALGLVCDIVATGGMSAVAGAVLCGVVAGVGNAVNQYFNYKIEKKSKTKNKKTNKTSQKNNLPGKKMPTSSNGKSASECNSFAEYVDVKSIAVSSITAMAFAPVSVGANNVVNSAFLDVETAGAAGFAAQFAANFAMGGNISILQSIIDLF